VAASEGAPERDLFAKLLGVVDQTMQPTQAFLWLRPSQPASSPAGGPTAHP
jgi:hypothetical protein